MPGMYDKKKRDMPKPPMPRDRMMPKPSPRKMMPKMSKEEARMNAMMKKMGK